MQTYIDKHKQCTLALRFDLSLFFVVVVLVAKKLTLKLFIGIGTLGGGGLAKFGCICEL